MKIQSLIVGGVASVIVVAMGGMAAALAGYLPSSKEEPKPVVVEKPCAECGVVVSVRQIEVKGQGTGLGAVAGGVAGAVVGKELSGGKDLGTLVGAAGGAIAGHQIERHARTTKRYQVQVRMTDGSVRTVTYSTAPAWKAGDRVRLENGKLVG